MILSFKHKILFREVREFDVKNNQLTISAAFVVFDNNMMNSPILYLLQLVGKSMCMCYPVMLYFVERRRGKM